MDWSTRLQDPKYWLLGVSAAAIVLHLTLVNRTNNSELFATAALFWLAAGSLVWDKQPDLGFKSGPIASAIGVTILAFAFHRSAALPSSEMILGSLPLLYALGTGLMASGLRELQRYWKEFVIFGLLAVNPLIRLVLEALNLPSLTAKAATFILWYTGFQVQRQDVFLYMVKDGASVGRVEVYGACSGVQSILQMINIAVLFLLLTHVKLNWTKKILCIATAILLGFFVNSARVSLMAILVSLAQRSAFQFWHDGQGSLIFSVIAVLLFGTFCWIAFLRQPPHKPDSGVSADD